RLRALLANLGGDGKRLRRMLSENFLIEAAYQAAGGKLLPPEFLSRHSYLEIHDSTNRAGMKNNLDVARVLGLISRDEQSRRLGDGGGFGRTTFYAETRYGSAAVRRMFLDAGGQARPVDEYEVLGRSALGALLAGDEDQQMRLRVADLGLAGDDLWRRMKQTGNVNAFAPLFGFPAGSIDPRVAAASADYFAITGWAEAMHNTGLALADAAASREALKERLGDVVKRTGEHFGDPLGMIMVYLAADENAARRAIADGERIERLEAAMDASQVRGAGAV
ncbi:MAG: hypothetical protein ACRD44_17155, partial [Bryobacteraceae bacterium]